MKLFKRLIGYLFFYHRQNHFRNKLHSAFCKPIYSFFVEKAALRSGVLNSTLFGLFFEALLFNRTNREEEEENLDVLSVRTQDICLGI